MLCVCVCAMRIRIFKLKINIYLKKCMYISPFFDKNPSTKS